MTDGMTNDARRTDPGSEQRWRGRPALVRLIRIVVFLGPVMIGIATSTLLVRFLVRPSTAPWSTLWWVGVFSISTALLYGADRLFRRLIPLATLFKLTLLFPDQAPSRFRVARNSQRLLMRRSQRPARGEEDVRASEEILALVSALDTHDKHTRGHSERTAVYSDLLARELKIPAADRDLLRWAALLHDVGKLSLPTAVLDGSRQPDEQDWKTIREHPRAGEQMAAPLMGWLGEWGRAIGEHHERIDGSGYPRGLAGAKISLGARIVAVADAYDTMTAGRPYRRPLGPKAAREEIARAAGETFDPKVCRALMSLSLGGNRRTLGISAWVGQLPVALGLDRFGQAIVTTLHAAGSAAAATAGAVALVATGILPGPNTPAAEAGGPQPTPTRSAPAPSAPIPEPSAAPTRLGNDAPTHDRPTATTSTTAPSTLAPIVPLVTTPSPCAGTRTVMATMDTWIVDVEPEKNHGDDQILAVQSKFRPELPSKAARQDRRSLVAFEVPDIPSHCVFDQALLRLYSTDADVDRTIEAWKVTSPWTERDVVWSNQPSFGGTPAVSDSGPGWRTWDVTPAVRSTARHGFLLKDRTEGGTGFTQSYASRESSMGLPPTLVLTVGER